jgi:hypothetical protein
MTNVAFDSSKNYLKQGFSGTVTLNKPATLDTPNDAYMTEYTITHNLGIIPLVRAWYEPDSDGVIFPVNGQKKFGTPILYNGGDIDFFFFVDEITTSTVKLRAERYQSDGSLGGTFIAHYRIYLDPAV